MKKGKFSLVAIVMLIFISNNVLPDIRLSHHDFSSASWTSGQTCLLCHTPHNANLDVTDSPLWNHTLSTASYQVYQSSTIDGYIGQPGGTSKLCLSCHDGTVAMENHGGSTELPGTRFLSVGNLGTDIGDDHPISITYNAALATADGELNDPTVTPSGLGGTIQEDLLSNNRIECSSCHDVHVARNSQGCSGCHWVRGQTTVTLSLRIDNTGSALCLTCHKK